ncbi:MAG TPA: hypothetical protein PKY99_10485, partial [Turneriella sp.]|nr:hypothetical protein [Turneriella sp.]
SAAVRLKDYLQVAEFPPGIQVVRPGDAALADVPTIPGDARQAAQVIRFLGEQVRAGSLEVVALVRVEVAGEYSFRTELKDMQGNTLRVMLNAKLAPGDQKIKFVFFGRAIRRHLRAGIFSLPGIVGEKLPDDGGAPGRLQYYAGEYRTQPHHAAQFSDKAWDSPEKRARIRALEREIAEERRSQRR